MTAALIGLGIGGSLLGGLLGSSGASKQAKAELQAARENRAFTENKLDESMARTLFSVLGPQEAEAYLRAALPTERFDQLFGRAASNPQFTDAQRTRLGDIDRQIQSLTQVRSVSDLSRRQQYAGQVQALQAERDALMAQAGGSPGVSGRMSLDSLRALGPGVTDQMRSLGASYDAATGGLMDYARSIEQQAQGFGQQERERITRDSADALTSANRSAQSALIGRGLGASTVLTGVMGQNAANIGRAREDALGALGDRQINLLTGIRGNTLSMLGGRSAGSTQLAQAPINTRLQLLTGGIANPWQQRDTSQFFPGVSPSGAAASTWGNLLGAAGGQALNLGMMGNLYQQFPGMFGGGR